MKRLLLIGIFALLLLAACQPESAGSSLRDASLGDPNAPADENLTQIVYQNLDALNQENLDAVLATIDPQAVGFASTRDAMKQLFDQYDLRYEIEKIEVVEKSATSARVRVFQVTRKINGPAFRDNRIEVIHTLTNVDGQWKFSDTSVVNIEYLN